MVQRDPEVLSEGEAARLWERAAHLQAEAARRVEAPEVQGAAMSASGYALTHVRSAALEAGKVEASEKNLEFLGDAWLSAREYRRSADALKRAAQVENNGEIWKRLAQVLAEEERWTDAIEAADQAVKAGAKDPGDALMIKGLASYNANRPKTAIAAFNQALRYEESRKQARQWLTFVESELEDIARAEAAAAELKAQKAEAEAEETQTN